MTTEHRADTTTWQITGQTQIVGVIGWPVEHSVSPPMHNAAFRTLNLDWCYIPLPVHPERIPEAVFGARALGFRGLNATVPHKQALLPLMDELTPAAKAIGAANTVIFGPDHIVGHNTDAQGFLCALRDEGFEPEDSTALVLGAGGAARAIVYALGNVANRVTVLNRTPERAARLVEAMGDACDHAQLVSGPLNGKALSRAAQEADLVVNATSVGMWPKDDALPWPEDTPFPSEVFLFDLIYNPRQTRLMRMAANAGARTANGLRMLVHQGAEAFTLWTGVEPPVQVMYQACATALGGE